MDDSANKENSHAVTKQKIVHDLKQNHNHPASWLQLISHELALVGGDAKKCSNLNKIFENARASVTKEFFHTAEYISLCLGHARWFITTCHYDHCKELLKWLKANNIGLNSADYYITFAHLESALGDDQKAQDHIRRGLQADAQPKKELEKYLTDFKHSINVAPLIFTPRRSPLAELNSQGTSTPSLVPSIKVLSPLSDASLTTPVRPSVASTPRTFVPPSTSTSSVREHSPPSENYTNPSATPLSKPTSSYLTTPSASHLTTPSASSLQPPTQSSAQRLPASTQKDWFKKEATRYRRLPPPSRAPRDEDSQMLDESNAGSNTSNNSTHNDLTGNACTASSSALLNPLSSSESTIPTRPPLHPTTSRALDVIMETMDISATNLQTPTSSSHNLHPTSSTHNFTQNSTILSDTSLSQSNLSQISQSNITINTSQSAEPANQNGELLRSQSDGMLLGGKESAVPECYTDPGVSKSVANEMRDTHPSTESYAPGHQMEVDTSEKQRQQTGESNAQKPPLSHKIQLPGHKQSQNRFPVYYQRRLEQEQQQEQKQQLPQEHQAQKVQQLPPQSVQPPAQQYAQQPVQQPIQKLQQPPQQPQLQQQQRTLQPQSSYPSQSEQKLLPAQSSYPSQSQEQHRVLHPQSSYPSQSEQRALPAQSSYPSQFPEQPRLLQPQSSYPSQSQFEDQPRLLQPQSSYPTQSQSQSQEQPRILHPQTSYPPQSQSQSHSQAQPQHQPSYSFQPQESAPSNHSHPYLPPAPIGQQYSLPTQQPPNPIHPITSQLPYTSISQPPPHPSAQSRPASSIPQSLPSHQLSKKSTKSAEEMQRNFELAQQWTGGRTFFVNQRPYIVLEHIGKGGSSKVYKVISANLEIYALKQVNLEKEGPSTIENYLNEIKLLETLREESCIIKLIDAEIDLANKVIFLVLEFGESDLSHAWQAHMKRSRAHSGNFLKVFWQQMLEAVHTVHQQRIVHSDLKLANFVLVKGAVKLIDFGIAKQISSDTTHVSRDELSGTINYMAPEALTDIGGDSGRMVKQGRPSDVWSLGCILYQMVYGNPPFHSLNLAMKFKCIPDKNYAIKFPDHPDQSLLEVLRACLQRDPALRPTIPQLLSHPFLMPTLRLQQMDAKLREKDEEIMRLKQQLKQLGSVSD